MPALHLGSEGYATDGVNGMVGIGTTSPSAPLTIQAAASVIMKTSLTNHIKRIGFFFLSSVAFTVMPLKAASNVSFFTEMGTMDIPPLRLSKSAVSIGLNKSFTQDWGIVASVSQTLGQNYVSHLTVSGIETQISQPVLFKETVRSMTLISIAPKFHHSYGGRISMALSAGPTLFHLQTEQAIKYGLGATINGNAGNTQVIPNLTDVTQSGYGAIVRLSIGLRLLESLSLESSACYFGGRYRREINYTRLLNSGVDPTFSDQRRTESFDGTMFGLGIQIRL